MTRRVVISRAAVAVALSVLAAAPAAALQPEEGQCVPLPVVDDRCESWQVVHDPVADVDEPYQQPSAMVTSTSADLIAVAGYGAQDLFDTQGQAHSAWRILGIDPDTGEVRWLSRPGLTDAYSRPLGIHITEDGTSVLVAGYRASAFGQTDALMVVMSLDAATGEVRWSTTVDGGRAEARSADARGWFVAEADGSVLVLGTHRQPPPAVAQGLVVVRLDADTGEPTAVWTIPGVIPTGTSVPAGLAVSNDGDHAVVGATVDGVGTYDLDMLAVGLDLADGGLDVTWSHAWDGVGAHAPDRVQGMAADPDDGLVVLTGISSNDVDGPPFDVDYATATIAYDMETGAQRWSSREMLAERVAMPAGVAVDDGRVVVVGSRSMDGTGQGYALGLDATDGSTSWISPVDTPDRDREFTTAVAINGDHVAVTGGSSSSVAATVMPNRATISDTLTVAMSASDGSRRWTARHNSTDIGDDAGRAVTVTPAGDVHVLSQVTRNVDMDENFYDLAVLGYLAAGAPPVMPDRLGFP